MTRPELQGTKRDITVGQLKDELGVDVLGRDADLDEHFFPVSSLDWHGGTVNDDQLIDVIYENTFTKSRSMRKKLTSSSIFSLSLPKLHRDRSSSPSCCSKRL